MNQLDYIWRYEGEVVKENGTYRFINRKIYYK